MARLPAPLVIDAVIDPAWIDANGHVTSGAYQDLFRTGTAPLFHAVGVNEAYIRTGHSVFNRECHIRYQRELRLGAPLQIFTWVAGLDDRSVHLAQEIRHASEGWAAASGEYLYGHVDGRARASSDWPPAMGDAFAQARSDGAATCPAIGFRISVRPASRFAAPA
jgi:acyl-CoA thioester hydrolase